jgi:hypothetical protein
LQRQKSSLSEISRALRLRSPLDVSEVILRPRSPPLPTPSKPISLILPKHTHTHTHTFKRESRDCYQSTKINKRRMAALYSTTCRSHSYSLLPSSSSSSSFHGQNHQRLNFSSYIAKRVLPAKVSFHSRRNYHLNVVLMQDG